MSISNKLVFQAKKACGKLLEQIWQQIGDYNEKLRKYQFEATPGTRDDILHALTYAMKLSRYHLSAVLS